jgi:hypothetical protein
MIGFLEVDALLDQVAILGQLADERIDLAQSQWRLRAAFEIPAHEAVLGHSQFQGRGAGFLRRAQPYFLASASTPMMRRSPASSWR